MTSAGRYITAFFVVVLVSLLVACGASTPAPFGVSISALPTAVVNSTYAATLQAKNGVAPYTWAITTGTLPAGLSLNTSTGAISGTPTTAGTSSFTVTVTDSSTPTPKTASASLQIVVNPPLGVTTNSLPAGVVGTAYNQTLAATGGITPDTWAVTTGSLPAGLTLNASTGAITGNPTGPFVGKTNFTVTVTDSESPAKTATANLSITISAPPLSVTTNSLVGGTLGSAYNATLAATGGVTPYTWQLTTGNLPQGLMLNANTGAISGTPTGNMTGPINFTVTVTDSEQPTVQTAMAALSITITAPPLSVTTTSLAVGVVGSTYSATLAATGGVSPYTWQVTTGNLPAGLSLNGNTGVISGMPTASGTTTFTVTVTDSETPTAQTAMKQLSITVNPQLAVTTTSLQAGVVGSAYNQTLAAAGGITPYMWAVTTGSLPAGLSLTANTGAITGNPTGPFVGATNFTVTVTDSESPAKTATANLSITISAPPLSVTTMSLAGGTLGTAYSATLAATGGVTPYTWSISVGSLPAGLGLNANTGVISGTPTGSVTGPINFTVKVTDSEQPTAQTATAALSITISAAPLSVVTTSLPVGVVGSAYSTTLTAAGGVSPYTWQVTTGNLPAGLLLNGNTGVISGTPTASGTTTFTVTVTDSETPTPQTAMKQLSITVNPQLMVTTSSLPNGVVGTAYNQTLQATGGITPYAWSFTGNLPTGLSLNANTGVISGTPTAAGTFNFTAKATDSETPAQSATANLSITINAQLQVTTSGSLPQGVINVTYSGATLQATGGVTPYTWSYTGNLPKGLNLNANTGAISGTPTVTGTFNFTAKVTDSGNPQQTAAANLSITINPALTITTQSLPSGVLSQAYNQTLQASGGITPYTWSISSGSLPGWASLNPSTGVISGTPNATGTTSFTVEVTDSESPTQSATQSLSITINNSAPLQITTSGLPQGVVETPYSNSAFLSATGGVQPYTWSILSGSLPPGLTLTPSTGQISGTPTAPGTFGFTAKVVDSSSPQQSATANLSITINSALAITTQSLPDGTVSVQYNQSVNASGGLTPYSWTITSGSLPPGLNYNTNDNSMNISGTPTTTGTYPFTVQVTDSENPQVSVSAPLTIVVVTQAAAYTVSGNVSYSGSQTGWVYLQLNNNNCQGCNGNNLGTSISEATLKSGGAFTIHGVPPGTYTLQAYMDNLGYGAENASNPTGSTANITVTNSGVSGVPLALSDPAAVNLSGLAPSWSGGKGSGAFSGGAFVSFQTIKNNNGIEMPASYTVQWSTSSSFSPVTGSKSFAATGGNNPWIVSGLTNGTAYYFRAQGVAGSSTSNWSGASPAFTIGAPTGGFAVSGAVTFSATATGPLYVGFYNQNTGTVYADVVGSKTHPPTSPASYSVNVPAGNNYYFFGFLDQNNSGMFAGAGQISNTQGNNQAPVAITGTTTNLDLTLSTANSLAYLTTQSTEQNGSTYYSIGFQVNGQVKQPVAVELATGPAPGVIIPADIANNAFGGGSGDKFNFYTSTNGVTPQVGDTYTLNVTYSDGTSGVLTVVVSAVLDAFATNLSPQGSGALLTPNFSWTDPANASNYTYQFWLCCDSQGTIWQIPGQNSNSNGFPYTITSITWDVDPTGSGDLPNESSLGGSSNYTWAITATDVNGNSAQVQVNFQTVQAPLTLQPAGGSLGSVTVGQNFNGAVNASGGIPGYTFYVNGSQVPNNGQQVSLGDNLFASNNGGSTLSLSGTPSSSGVVSFTVSVTDSQSNSAGPYTYTITVNTAQPLAITTSSLPGGNVGQVYYSYVQANGGVPPYTWSVTSGNLPNGLSIGQQTGEITGAPTATGTSSFTVTVTDSTLVTATATLSISVLSCPNNSVLNGHYAFMANGWDDSSSSTAASAVGSLVANGSGTITGGLIDTADQNSTPGTQSGTITGGTYCVGSNNLATITMNFGGGLSGSVTFAAAMDSSDGNGHTISYDVNNSNLQISGLVRKQTTGAFSTGSIKGNYAFGIIGADQSFNRLGLAGQFNSNGSGTLSGEADFDDESSQGQNKFGNTTLTANDFTVASSGRGTATITLPSAGGGVTWNFVFEVVSSSEMLMMALDSTENPPVIFAGQVLEQSGSFTNASLDGLSVIEIQGLDTSGQSPVGDVQIGLLSTNGSGGFTVTLNENDGGTVTLGNVDSGNYSVSSSGRVTLTGAGNHPPIFYLVAKNQAFAIGTDNSVISGTFEPQSGSNFTNASLTGNYYGGSQPPEDSNTSEEVDSVNSNGAGVFNVTTYSNSNCGSQCGGGPNGSNISVDYSVQSNGLVTLTCGSGSGGNCTPIGTVVGYIYIISDSQVVFMPAQDQNPKLDDFHQ